MQPSRDYSSHSLACTEDVSRVKPPESSPATISAKAFPFGMAASHLQHGACSAGLSPNKEPGRLQVAFSVWQRHHAMQAGRQAYMFVTRLLGCYNHHFPRPAAHCPSKLSANPSGTSYPERLSLPSLSVSIKNLTNLSSSVPEHMTAESSVFACSPSPSPSS